MIGKLTQRSFETEGNKRTTVEIVASQVALDLSFATASLEKATQGKQSA